MKSHLIGHDLLFDNQSKDILNAFDLVLMRSCFEMGMRKVVEKFECISILNSKFFMKISIYVISPIYKHDEKV